jgi:outer membrane protein OmpA-like peptidoglycan-associated protein
MREARRRWAVALIAGLGVVLWADDGRAAAGVRDWIEALQPPAAAPQDVAAPPQPMPARPLAIAALSFEANGSEMTAAARAELDHLASALIAPQFEGYVFEIRWYADPKKAGPADQALSERRAAAMYTYLQTRRGILPTRVMLRWGRRKPLEVRDDVPADTVIIKVVNLGRE